MNQILVTYNKSETIDNILLIEKKRNKKNFLIVFLFSNSICIIILFYFFYSYFLRLNQNVDTNMLKSKYNINTLYPIDNNYTALKLSNDISIIGLIDIPKINISYPILSNSNEDLLKISVCRFSGPFPNRTGNLCIAGHNYNNTLMFSKLSKLNIGDCIYITDLNNIKLEYIVYSKFKVKENDMDCTKDNGNVEITLITCNNNNNSERIVVKAKVKE